MHINKLTLRNIGAYHGELNKFDFRTTSERNVILLGGKNGAGKTTILESLRIVLFGSMAYGFITENEPYFRKIRTLLNRKALNEGLTDHFQITLDYTATEDFELHDYSLIRSWRIKGERLRESISVKKDNQFLTTQETADFQNRLREEMPPRLFELCLFDGEDISRIVSEEKIPDYLKEAGKVLFNLDLFSNLEKDLTTYRAQYARQNADTANDVSLRKDLESEIAQLQKELHEKQEQLLLSEDTITNLSDSIKQDKKDFETHGGLIHDERQKLISKINSIEQKRKSNTDQVKHFISAFLPFFIARRQLEQVDVQLESEKHYESFEYVAATLEKEQLGSLLQNVFASNNVLEDVDSLYDGILGLIRPNQTTLLHRASFEQRSEVYNLNKQIQNVDASNIIKLFDENADLLEKSQTLRKKVETNDQSGEFKELLEQIENKTKLVEQHNIKVVQLNNEIQSLSEDISEKRLLKNKIEERINEHYKSENSYAMTEKLLNVSQRFRERQWRKKLDDVANETTQLVNILFRKKNYIKRIHIDHISFELKLYNKSQHEITKERLSAGEKEMLMLAVILAMFRVSGWKLPFVFDTLMGRLDQDHKKALIQQFIPRCGEQVLMFTTDSEITTDQFKLINEITSRCYTLEYNVLQESAEIIKDRFFNIAREAVH